MHRRPCSCASRSVTSLPPHAFCVHAHPPLTRCSPPPPFYMWVAWVANRPVRAPRICHPRLRPMSPPVGACRHLLVGPPPNRRLPQIKWPGPGAGVLFQILRRGWQFETAAPGGRAFALLVLARIHTVRLKKSYKSCFRYRFILLARPCAPRLSHKRLTPERLAAWLLDLARAGQRRR